MDEEVKNESSIDEQYKQLDDMLQNISDEANEDIKHFRDIQSEDAKKENDETELTGGEDVKNSSLDIISAIDSGNQKEENESSIKASLMGQSNDLNLSDDEISQMITLIMKYKDGEKFSYYKSMPSGMQDKVRSLALELGVGADKYNSIAGFILDEFSNNSDLDKAFVDFEQSINEALNMPNMIDLYSESIKNTMETKLPELAEKARAESPEKADSLLKIRDAFVSSYKLDRLVDAYKTNPRVRKAVKRYYDWNKYCEEIDWCNQKTRFKMPNAAQMHDGLVKIFTDVFNDEPSNNDYAVIRLYGEEPEILAEMFISLWCRSCENLNYSDIVDASYIYYGMKNIIMLKFAEENKTDFSKEIISNICSVMNDIFKIIHGLV